MSFYVTLPSNASEKIFPDNNAGHYFVKLPHAFELNQQYEVGLAEIQIPNTYFNVLEGEAWISYYPPGGKPSVLLTGPPGVYKSVEDLVDRLNLLFGELDVEGRETIIFRIRLHWHDSTKQVVLRLYEEGATIRISPLLQSIFRFPANFVTDADPILVGENGAEKEMGLKNMYVYCDLVAPRPVGDVMVSLLRTLPITDRASTSVFREYNKPHYLPLSRYSFDTVEVLLTDDIRKTIPFTSGSSVLTLHFRKRRQLDLD